MGSGSGHVLKHSEYIHHVHTAYSISRRHIACPHSIFHLQKTYSMSIQHIPIPRKHIACPHSIFYPQKTYSMSILHIPCLQSIHTMSPEHTYSIHIHPRGSGPQKIEFSTFSQIHPMTFGLCLGIITDTF